MIFNMMDTDLTEDPERIDFTPNDHLTVCPTIMVVIPLDIFCSFYFNVLSWHTCLFHRISA